MRNQYLEQKPDVEELITSHMELVRQIAWHMRGSVHSCLLYTSPSPRDRQKSRMPSSA